MKKIKFLALFIISLCLFAGCSMDNTPTKKVENFLNNYRNLDESVITQMEEIVSNDALMSDNQRTKYKDVLRKQYQDLNYQIKDEKIDGDAATVEVEIEVYDLYKVTKDAETYYQEHLDEFKDDNGNLSSSKYIDYRLDLISKQTQRVKYNLTFTLSKVDNVWILDDIDDTTRQKIHGLYAY